MSMKIQVGIADDNNFLIRSVKEKLALFENVVVAFTAHDGQDCLDMLPQYPGTDLVLMDIEMPVLNGIEATRLIKHQSPQLKVIVLTVFDDDENIFNAIQSGADGYLLKDITPYELYEAIVQTLEGGAVMTPSIAMKTLQLLRHAPPPPKDSSGETVRLSSRETEVLEQLSKGLPYTAIAANLFISPATVRRHTENIYRKLQVHSKIEAVEMARRKRML